MVRPENKPVEEGKAQSTKDVNRAIRGLLERSHRVKITGLAGQNALAVGLSGDIEINASGTVGKYLGAFNSGPVIILKGSSTDAPGDSMLGGGIIIEGDCGKDCGLGMTGGIIVVKGTASDDAGRLMSGGTIIIGGDAKGDVSSGMKGGTVIVTGSISGTIGPRSSGGTIYSAGTIGGKGDGITETKLSDKDLNMLERYFSHYGIGATPRTFRKFVSEGVKSRMTGPFPSTTTLSDRPPGRELLDEIGIITSDLELSFVAPSIKDVAWTDADGPNVHLNLETPFIVRTDLIEKGFDDLNLGIATGCSLSSLPFSVHGKPMEGIDQLLKVRPTRTIYRLGRGRDIELGMVREASILEVPLYEGPGMGPPEIRNGKDLIELVQLLREIRGGPIMVTMRASSVEKDMDAVLVSAPDSVLVADDALTGRAVHPDDRSELGSIVHALTCCNRHMVTMGARRKGTKLFISGRIREPMDALKLLCLGADGIDLGRMVIERLKGWDVNGTSGNEGEGQMDWAELSERTAAILKEFMEGVSLTMSEMNIPSFSKLTPDRLHALTYDAASVTGLPLFGYGSVLPMWMQ